MLLPPAYSILRGQPRGLAAAAIGALLTQLTTGTAAAAAAAAADPAALQRCCSGSSSLQRRNSSSSGSLQRCYSGSSGSPEPDIEAVVIGAGVIGLAIARELALAGRAVLLLEAASAIGTETSSRNSEVIHAGLYYPQGSLKARLCVAGRAQLYAFCAAHGVPHRRVGKLLVASSESQLDALSALRARAAANGVTDLQPLSARETAALEPAVRCQAALLSPSTGIVDSHSFMAELHRQFEEAGGTTAFHSRVVGGVVSGLPGGLKRLAVSDANSGEGSELTASLVVSAAGLHAQAVAESLQGLPPASIPPLHMAKGSYFSLAPWALTELQRQVRGATTHSSSSSSGSSSGSSGSSHYTFKRLVYPLPEPATAGLGTHLTLDLAGDVRFGPDVEWLPPGTDPRSIDYAVDPARAAPFYAAIRAYLPGLPDGALLPSYSGVRPKVSGPGQPAGDFVLQGPRAHGIPGLLNLFGIESPGLTASLALAQAAAAELLRREAST